MDSPGWGGCEPLSHVADYTGAAMALAAGPLMASAIQAQRHGVVLLPTALVVSADQLSVFTEYCRASMAAGILKAAFLRREDAVRWAARQAAVREHWLRLRAATQSDR